MGKNELYDLAEQIRHCTACPLWKTRTLAVPGEGPENPKIMFVGEAPGAEEDHQGIPFVGPAGKFLDQLFKETGINRKEVFLTGAVKCHPPKNRTPTAKELEICKKLWLDLQIALIKTPLIVILGVTALKSLWGKMRISEVRGKTILQNHQKYFITYHPSAGRRFPEIKKFMQQDFSHLKKILKRI